MDKISEAKWEPINEPDANTVLLEKNVTVHAVSDETHAGDDHVVPYCHNLYPTG